MKVTILALENKLETFKEQTVSDRNIASLPVSMSIYHGAWRLRTVEWLLWWGWVCPGRWFCRPLQPACGTTSHPHPLQPYSNHLADTRALSTRVYIHQKPLSLSLTRFFYLSTYIPFSLCIYLYLSIFNSIYVSALLVLCSGTGVLNYLFQEEY